MTLKLSTFHTSLQADETGTLRRQELVSWVETPQGFVKKTVVRDFSADTVTETRSSQPMLLSRR